MDTTAFDEQIPTRRRSGRRLVSPLMLGGVVVGILLLVGCAITGPGAPNGGGSAYTPEATAGSSRPPVPVPAAFRQLVEERIARGLHLTVAQVQVQLRDTPGADLMVVAKAKGLALDQVSTLVLDALQAASDQMVSAGTWTQRQADADMQYWRQQSMGTLIATTTNWILSQ